MSSLPEPRLYDASTDTHLLESMAKLHAACIEIDHTLATFLPPLSHEKIIASWTTWSMEVLAGRRIIIVQPAEKSGQVAGVASLYMPDTETGSHRGEVGRLLVSPSYRKRGLARVLMSALEAEARGLGRWMLTLDTTIGSGAEHVYPKLGYKEVGVVPNFGFSPEDGSLRDEMFFYKDLRRA